MKIKRWLFVVASLSLAAAACGDDTGAGGGGETENDLGGREITVAVENAYLPFNYIDPATGEGAGWDYDAVSAICDRINCVPVFQETGWDGMILAVSEGQFDVAADGITITDERAEIVDFSQGYISVEQRLMVRLDEDRFNTLDEFEASDLTLGTQIGTTNYEVAADWIGEDRIEGYDQFAFVVQALINGDVDAVIIDDTAGLGYVGENADQIRLIDGSLSSDELGFVFAKGSDLVEPFNQALDEMEADGTMAELADRYFTDKFTITYDDL
jgi:polar amino acid transport system substrate-binding protein